MRNVTLRVTGKGVAVVLEQTILVDKKLFDNWVDALKYVSELNVDEAFRRNRNRPRRNDKTEAPKTQENQGEQSPPQSS